MSTSSAAADARGRPHLPAVRLRLVWLGVLVVIGALLAVQVGRQVYANWAINQEAERVRAQIEQTLAENEALRRQLDYLRSDAYVSAEARRLFNLGRPGEQVLIIPPGAATPPIAESDEPAPPPPPLVDQWLELFFGA